MRREDEIQVTLIDRGRKYLYMRFIDPDTGKLQERSTGESNERYAERAAGVWQKEIEVGTYKSPSSVTWSEFRLRYENEVVPSLAEKTAAKISATFNALEQYLPVVADGQLKKLTASRISVFQSKLREEGRAEDTIKGHLAHLQAALN